MHPHKVSTFALVLVAVVIAASCGSDEKKSSTPYVEPEGDLGTSDMAPGLNNIDPLLECGQAECELSCEVLADPNFCWQRAVREVYACMEGVTKGTMVEADRCVVGGVEVAFSQNLVSETIIDKEDWDFEIITGDVCARVQDTEDAFQLDTRFGTVRAEFTESDYTVTCENGEVWRFEGEVTDLLQCRDENDSLPLPGVITFSSGPEFGFGLSPADGNLFQCTFEE